MNGQLINLGDYADAAQRLLPDHLWDYVAGGCEDERVLARNRSALGELTLRPRYLRDVADRDLSTTLLGAPVSMPVMLSPAAFQDDFHPDGELATSRGGERSGVLTVVPSLSGRYVEVAAHRHSPLWLQIYHRSREVTEEIVARALAGGYLALCLTVDVPVPNTKERDLRNGFLPPYTEVRYVRHRTQGVDLRGQGSPFTWADLEWLRSLTSLPIVLKGIMTAEDARAAADSGAAAVIVSNHGGRLFDATASAIEILPEVVAAVGDEIEVYVDSGFRRGSDILKALALGARAVGIGRPWFWGLAVAGADGVHEILEILRRELDTAVAMCGQTSVRELESDLLRVPSWWTPSSPAPRPAAPTSHPVGAE